MISLFPRLKQIFEGIRRDDPPTKKKLPVEQADVPEKLVEVGQQVGATEKEKAVGDSALIAFYYLLRIGEYTVKKGTDPDAGGPRQTKTEQFKLCDVVFFATHTSTGHLFKVTRNARKFDIMRAKCATLKLDNQKNGWKGVCINHEHNGEKINCPVRALGRRYLHIRGHTSNFDTLLSAYWEDGEKCYLHNQDMSGALKWAVKELDYLGRRGIPVERIDTHSLCVGGACSLALAGYSDTQIQKMGRWRGATFKEYIREELSVYSEGMSKLMKKCFGFVNVNATAFEDVTEECVGSEYDIVPAAE